LLCYLLSGLRTAPTSPVDPSARARILLVDDNLDGLIARKAILEEIGHTTTLAADPKDALALLAQHSFDLVITDYRMPGMTGVELLGKVRELDAKVPIILISGFVDTLGLNEENTGADAVIQKSANEVQQLVRCVQRLLRAPRKPSTSSKAMPRKRAKGVS